MISRLQGRSTAELITRARQGVMARLGRVGLEPTLRPAEAWLRGLDASIRSEAELVEWLRVDAPAAVLPGAADPAATAAVVAEAHPTEPDRLAVLAERIAKGRFDLLGHRDLSFGMPIDWHLDPTTGIRAPETHWSRIDNLDAALVGDHKVIWELNRQQNLHLLARVSLLTGGRWPVRVVMEHLDAWMEANPPHTGINWSSSLELAYRSIAWLWTLLWLREEELDPRIVTRALQYLELHGRHIETHLSTYYSPNTHLTGEALGLLYLGTLLPILPAAERWRRTGWNTLLSELDRHIEPDGTYFERATYYHRYTVDIYTHAFILGRDRPERERSLILRALDRLLDHSMAITRPDGGTPLMGDDDGGHLWMPRYDRPTDFRPTLSNGGILMGRGDLAWVAGGIDPESLWLLGPDAAQAWQRLRLAPPEETSMAFRDGGYCVLRDGWSGHAYYMLFDAGPHGALNCGHAHADALSFELAAGGAPLLVDPGTFSYADSAARDRFRRAAVHNTVTVDGEGASLPAGPFQWARVVDVHDARWSAGKAFDYVDGTVGVGKGGHSHRREVLFAHDKGWLIRDRIGGQGRQTARIVFQGAPGRMRAHEVAPGVVSARFEPLHGEWPLDIVSWGRDLSGHAECRWVSALHGRRETAPAWVVDGPAGQEVFTLLLPVSDGGECQLDSRRVGRQLHLQVGLGRTRHDLWLGDGSVFGTEGLRTDARAVWKWSDGTVGRLVAVDTSRLEIEGFPLPAADSTGPCVEARRTGGEWIPESTRD